MSYSTPTDAARALASHGRDWDDAVEFGVDVTLILRNLELSPHQRLRRAAEHQAFIDSVQRRTLDEEQRARLARQHLWDKIEALGGPDPAWPEALRDGRRQ